MSLRLLKHGAVLTIGNVVAGGLSYIFMILAARHLGPAEMGTLGSLLAIFYIISLPMDGAIGTLVAQRVARNRDGSLQDRTRTTVRGSLVIVLRYVAVGLVILAAVSPLMRKGLDLDGYTALLALAACIAFFAVYSIFRGALQGLEQFALFSAVVAGEAAVRLVLLLGLPTPLLSASSALAIYPVGYVLATTIIAIRIRFPWRDTAAAGDKSESSSLSRHALLTAIAFCLLGTLSQLDMVAAKYFLSDNVAGYYAGVNSLVKTPLRLISLAFSMAMFPSVVALGARTSRALSQLAAACFASLLATLSAAAVCSLYPQPLVLATLGESFAPLAAWLGPFALALVPPTLLAVLARFYIELDTRVLVLGLVIGLIVQVVSLALYHGTPQHVMLSMALGNGLPTMFLTVHLLVRRPRRAADSAQNE